MRGKILVVDDEIHITILLGETLRLNGYHVTVASDGVEALEKVNADRPDVIVLDIKMPRLDGWEVCQQLKSDSRTSGIPIIIASAFAQKEDQKKSFDLGADAFLPKPFEISTVIETIEKLI